MEAVAAVGLVSSIITFIDAGSKVIRAAKEIHESTDGASDETANRETVANSAVVLSQNLQSTTYQRLARRRPELDALVRECQSLATEVLKVSEETKARDPGSKRQALVAGWKNFSKRSAFKSLEERLEKCRSQLTVELVNHFHQDSAQRMSELHDLMIKDASVVSDVAENVKQLQQGLHVERLNDNVLDQLRQMLQLQKEALQKVHTDRILRSLRFDRMDARRDQIKDPQGHTFAWIMGDFTQPDLAVDDNVNDKEAYDSSLDDVNSDAETDDTFSDDDNRNKKPRVSIDDRMKQSSERLLCWLSSGEGIFHISGKLGSGKSTLMGFVSNHEQTKKELQSWAGDRSLMLASFFFWRPGSLLQNTLQGLYRSILHDVLKQCPSLMPDILPNHWGAAQRLPTQVHSELEISARDIKKAFNALMSNEHLYDQHRLCLFIDGLDEFAETENEDYRAIVNLFTHWVGDSRGRLKLCVSSREENAFMNGFQDDQRIRLHHLTLNDMKLYTMKLLDGICNSQTRDRFVELIPERADGIFLWTALATRTIRREIESETGEEALLEVLDELPRDLQRLFTHIVDKMEKRDRRRLFHTVAVLKALKNVHLKGTRIPELSPIAYSFLDEYRRDKNFASNINHHSKFQDGDTPKQRSIRAEKLLRASSRGLVETRECQHRQTSVNDLWTKFGPGHGKYLEFTHRSIVEVFEEDELSIEMENTLTSFDALDAFSSVTMAAASFSHDTEITILNVGANLDASVYSISEDWSLKLLKFMDSFSTVPDYDKVCGEQILPIRLQPGGINYLRIGTVLTRGTSHLDKLPRSTFPRDRGIVFDTLLLAAMGGNFEVFRWKWPSQWQDMALLRRSFLANVVLSSYRWNQQICDFLFNQGLLSDRNPCLLVPLSPYYTFELLKGRGLNMWQRFLAERFCDWYFDDTMRVQPDIFSHIVECFLANGEVDELRATLQRPPAAAGKGHQFRLCFDQVEIKVCESDSNPFAGFRHVPDELTQMIETTNRLTFTLRDWIEVSSPSNKERLLSLLDEPQNRANNMEHNAT